MTTDRGNTGNTQGVDAEIEDYDSSEDDDSLEDDLDILKAYSITNTSEMSETCDMHPPVKFCTQKWLSTFDDVTR